MDTYTEAGRGPQESLYDLTVIEAAEILGLSRRRVRELAANREILARKRGRDWQISSWALAAYEGTRLPARSR